MTIVGEVVAPIIMGYCGYYGEYGDCLSHTAGMLWGDWNVCVIETPRSSLNGKDVTALSAVFLKSSRPSLPLKKAPPLTPTLSPQERGRKPPYSVLGTASLYGWRTIKGLAKLCGIGPPGYKDR